MVARRTRRAAAKKPTPAPATPVAEPEPAKVEAETPAVEESEEPTTQPEDNSLANTTTEADVTAETIDEETVENDEEDNDDAENEEDEEAEDPNKPLTIEDKIERLDQLSKAHPFALIANLAKLSNHYKSYYEITKKTEGEGDKAEKYMEVVARYGSIKINVGKLAGENFRYAKKIGADLLLHHLYPEDHEIDDQTKEIVEKNQPTTETDEEWYKEKKEAYEKSASDRVDRILKKVRDNDRYSDEQKKEKTERFEKWRVFDQDLMDYDDVYKVFDNPYFRVMHNAITIPKHKNLSYVLSLQKAEDPNVQSIDQVNWIDVPTTGKGEQRSEETKAFYEELSKNAADENAPKPKIRVTINVSKNGLGILELQHAAENNNLKEIKSDAAYKVLEQLLRDGTIDKVSRKELKNTNDKRGGRNNQKGRGNKNQKNNKRGNNNKGGNRNLPNKNKAKGQGGKTGTVGKNTNKTPIKQQQNNKKQNNNNQNKNNQNNNKNNQNNKNNNQRAGQKRPAQNNNNTARPLGGGNNNNNSNKFYRNNNNQARPNSNWSSNSNNMHQQQPMMMQQPMMAQGGYNMGGGYGQQQMMMMPVMMNANGQYMIPQNAQQMMMMQQPQQPQYQNTARPMMNTGVQPQRMNTVRPTAVQPRHMANNNNRGGNNAKRGGRGGFRGRGRGGAKKN